MTIPVTSAADSGPGTLRQALLDAAPDDEIEFVVSQVLLTGTELVVSADVNLIGPGSTLLTIQRVSGTGRLFNLTSGSITARGLTLDGGNGATGGALRNEATLTIQDIVFQNCSASSDGGAIWNSGTLTLLDVAIQDCESGAAGGGVWNSGTVYFSMGTNSITNNQAASVGGGFFNSGSFEFLGRLSGNSAGGNGGAFQNNGALGLVETTVQDNLSGGSGGAGYNGGTLYFRRSSASANTADSCGGFFNNIGGTLEAINSTISGHTTGIQNATGSVGLRHCTVTNNSTGVANGEGSALTVYNSIIAGNITADLVSAAADVTSDGHNLFGTVSEAITPGTGDQFDLTAEDLVIGPLADNGGPTFSHKLLYGSPAIDAGDNTDAPLTDQRGFPRVVNNTIDIGAYESPRRVRVCVSAETVSQTLTNPSQAEIDAAQAAVDAEALASATALAVEELDDCPVCAPLDMQGMLTVFSPRATERPGSYAGVHSVYLAAGTRIQIVQSSTDFDSYLFLIDPEGNVVAEDDESGGAPDSAIIYDVLVTGDYTIEASSYSDDETGQYQLQLTCGGVVAAMELDPVECQAEYSNQLTATGGTGPYTFTMVQGFIPSINPDFPFSLSPDGLFTGTMSYPSQYFAGPDSIYLTVKAADSLGQEGLEQQFVIPIAPCCAVPILVTGHAVETSGDGTITHAESITGCSIHGTTGSDGETSHGFALHMCNNTDEPKILHVSGNAFGESFGGPDVNQCWQINMKRNGVDAGTLYSTAIGCNFPGVETFNDDIDFDCIVDPHGITTLVIYFFLLSSNFFTPEQSAGTDVTMNLAFTYPA